MSQAQALPPNFIQASFATLWRRIAAYLTDFAILFTILIPLQIILWRFGNGFPYTLLSTGLQVELWVLSSISLPAWLYFSCSEQSLRQATLGKQLFRLQVTRSDGRKIGFGRAFLRTLIKLLPWELTHLTLLIPIPIWWQTSPKFPFGLVVVYTLLGIYSLAMLLNKRRQSIHDILMDTVVIRKESP